MASRRVLLVEGIDDQHVLRHVCRNRGLSRIDEILPQNGVDKLLENFPIRLKESGLEVLGVIIDADIDLASRWHSIRDRLKHAGYDNIPDIPNINGTIVSPPADSLLPRVDIWLMPNNQDNGILEDFLRFLVPPSSALFNHVEASIAAIPESEVRFSAVAKPKAIIHTWLAWQEEPGKPLGTSITARYLDPDVGQVNTLVQWLNHLFYSSE